MSLRRLVSVDISGSSFFQVLLLFFMFVMAFSSTFYLLLDEETVRLFEHCFYLCCSVFKFTMLGRTIA